MKTTCVTKKIRLIVNMVAHETAHFSVEVPADANADEILEAVQAHCDTDEEYMESTVSDILDHEIETLKPGEKAKFKFVRDADGGLNRVKQKLPKAS